MTNQVFGFQPGRSSGIVDGTGGTLTEILSRLGIGNIQFGFVTLEWSGLSVETNLGKVPLKPTITPQAFLTIYASGQISIPFISSLKSEELVIGCITANGVTMPAKGTKQNIAWLVVSS